MHRSKRIAVPWLILLVVAGSLFLAACGDSSSSSDSTESTASSEPTEEGESASGVSSSTMDVALEFSGGEEGEADQSLPPIKIGFVNQEGQAFSFPEMRAAAEATVAFANEHLGGIDGHPIELVPCALTGTEAQQRCAVQMLDAKVPVINLGLSGEDAVAFTKTLGGKIPLQAAITSTPALFTAENTYSYNSARGLTLGMVEDAKELSSETNKASFLSNDSEGGKISAESLMLPLLEELEVPANEVVYYPAATVTTPEMVAALQSAGAADAGGILSYAFSPGECSSLYNALKQLAITAPVISQSGCASSTSFEEAIGTGPEGWRVWAFGPLPQIEEPEPEAYKEIMEAGGQEKYVYEGFAPQEMGVMMVILKAANEIGADALTPEALSEKFKEVKDPLFMWAPGINCAEPIEPKNEPAVCGGGAAGAEFSEGKWVAKKSVSLRDLAQ